MVGCVRCWALVPVRSKRALKDRSTFSRGLGAGESQSAVQRSGGMVVQRLMWPFDVRALWCLLNRILVDSSAT